MTLAVVSVKSSSMTCWQDAERRLLVFGVPRSRMLDGVKVLDADVTPLEKWTCLVVVDEDILDRVQDRQAIGRTVASCSRLDPG